MNKKIFCFLLIFIVPLIMLCGCSSILDTHTNIDSYRFERVNYDNCSVYIDKETKVMYLWVKNGYGGGLTVMLNSDGTPMLWEGEL